MLGSAFECQHIVRARIFSKRYVLGQIYKIFKKYYTYFSSNFSFLVNYFVRPVVNHRFILVFRKSLITTTQRHETFCKLHRVAQKENNKLGVLCLKTWKIQSKANMQHQVSTVVSGSVITPATLLPTLVDTFPLTWDLLKLTVV